MARTPALDDYTRDKLDFPYIGVAEMLDTESNRIEFRRELNDKLERTVVALLNTSEGGQIFVGVDDEGKAVGIPDIDTVQLQIIDRAKNNISPSVMGLFEYGEAVLYKEPGPFGTRLFHTRWQLRTTDDDTDD